MYTEKPPPGFPGGRLFLVFWVDLKRTVFELTEEFPELIEIMAGLGLSEIENPSGWKSWTDERVQDMEFAKAHFCK